MKKIYLKPEVDVVALKNENLILMTSSMGTGDPIDSGEGDAPGQREELEIFLFQLMGL